MTDNRDKYDITHTWEEPCGVCGKPVVMCNATWEVRGPYHDGCFGWPMCSCKKEHQGDCNER